MLVPALLAGIGLLAAWWSRERTAWGPRSLGAPVLALAFLAGQALLVGAPALPGPERTLSFEQWLFWIVLAAGVVLPLESALHARPAGLFLLRVAGAALLVDRLASAKLAHAWSGAQAWLQLGALSAPLLVVWLSTNELARRRRGFGLPAALCAACALAAPAVLLAGSALVGQLFGVLAGALGACAVVALLRPGLSLAGGGASVLVLAGYGLGAGSRLYGGLALGPALCLAAAPLAAWIGELPALRERALARELVRVLASALVAGAGLAWVAATREVSDYY